MKNRLYLIIGLAVISACSVSAATENAMVRLCPQPQEMRILDGRTELDLSQGLTAHNLSPESSPLTLAISRLRKSLGEPQPTGRAIRLAVGSASDWKTSKALANLPADLRLSAADLAAAAELPADGYILRASGNGIRIIGKDGRGAAYGVETIAELARANKKIPPVEIKDWPATEFRAAYAVDAPIENLRDLVDCLFRYRLNYLVIESDIYYDLATNKKAARTAKEKFDYCRSVGVEPIPEVQNFGHGMSVLARDPATAEATPMRDRSMTFGPDELAVSTDKSGSFTVKIANGQFEEGRGSEFAGWTDLERCVSEGEGPDGSRCVLITRSEPGMARMSQTFDVMPNGRYELSMDTKTEKGEGFLAYFEVYAGERVVNCGAIRGSSGWQQRSLRFESRDSKTITVYLRIQEGMGKAWFDNVECRMLDPMGLANLIVTPEQPLVVKSLDGNRTYREGADYSLTAGEMSPFPYVPEKGTPWKLERIPSGDIEVGETVLVSYDWVPENSRSYCPSDPRTQKIMEKTITATVKLLKPEYLHIGHDEPAIINLDGRCKSRGLRAHEIFADNVLRMRDYARKVDPNVRIMMWADVFYRKDGELLPFAFVSDERCTFDEAAELLPKDVVQCVWWYDGEMDWLAGITEPLVKSGFSVTVSPWHDLNNAYTWGKIARKFASNDRFLGMFLTTWGDNWKALPLCSDLMWNLAAPDFSSATSKEELERLITERYAGLPIPGAPAP
jgi:hypothetical protein